MKDRERYGKSCEAFTPELFISMTWAGVVDDVPGDGGEPGGGVTLRIHR